jgi:transcriptional regulator with XRE-family HTH domain
VELRERKKITQEKLQELSGFDTRQIGRIARAETNASISIIKAIADVLKVSIREILMIDYMIFP